jgi:hypothetical protein
MKIEIKKSGRQDLLKMMIDADPAKKPIQLELTPEHVEQLLTVLSLAAKARDFSFTMEMR